MLILSRKLNERIVIGDNVEVSVVEIKGDHVKLGINAPRDVKVYRHEVYQAIQAENKAAARAPSDLGSLAGLFNQAPPEDADSEA